MNELRIEYIPLEDLTPYEKNARIHTEVDLATIENSIKEFGMCDPIGIWSDKNVIVEGHGRMLALKALGHTEAPCIRLDHLTDEQRRAYALAHNKTAEMSKWDFEIVDSEIAELDLDIGCRSSCAIAIPPAPRRVNLRREEKTSERLYKLKKSRENKKTKR